MDVACLVLYNAAGEVFAARRPAGKSLGGCWEFPGGKVEELESPEAALRREIREELQIELGDVEALPSVEHDYSFGQIRLIPFRAIHDGRPIRPTEHSECAWVSADQLLSLDWAPADISIIQHIRGENH